MERLVIGFAAVLGLIVGSFLNVAILRGNKEEKLGGRSHCPFCKRRLSVKELIPVLSFLWQKGRCLSCGQKISWQYPLVESLTAIIYAVTVWFFLNSPFRPDFYNLIFLILLLAGLAAAVVIAVSDLRFKTIPNGAVLTLFLLGLFLIFIKWYRLGLAPAGKDFVASVFISLLLASIWFFSKGRAMGFGDAKLIFTTSLILGFPGSLSAFLFSFWLGGATGLVFLAMRTHGLKSQLPFGPFILVGSILAYFFSQSFLNLTGLHQLL